MTGVTVTTSWDDGHVLDLRLARLLDVHGLAATFYVAPRNRELGPLDRLDASAITELATRFEIGSHTMTHPVLTRLPAAEVRREVVDAKRYLEDLLDRPVPSFCYPRGRRSASVEHLVAEAGHRFARTTAAYRLQPPTDPLRAGAALETARPPLALAPVHVAHRAVVARVVPWRSWRWDVVARGMFDRVLVEGGHFHLWGHSWVLDARRDWQRLDGLLAHLAGRDGVAYGTNAEIVAGAPT